MVTVPLCPTASRDESDRRFLTKPAPLLVGVDVVRPVGRSTLTPTSQLARVRDQEPRRRVWTNLTDQPLDTDRSVRDADIERRGVPWSYRRPVSAGLGWLLVGAVGLAAFGAGRYNLGGFRSEKRSADWRTARVVNVGILAFSAISLVVGIVLLVS
jgi:hypothetical protein